MYIYTAGAETLLAAIFFVCENRAGYIFGQICDAHNFVLGVFNKHKR